MMISRPNGRKLPSSEVEYRYFRWLCERAGFSNGFATIPVDSPASCYTHISLAQTLFETPFRFLVPNDNNRVSDAKKLREHFCNFCSDFSDYTILDIKEISVLEVLIAFAERIDTVIMRGIEENDVDRSIYWLWVMLDNLGISNWDDNCWDYEAYRDVMNKLDIFLDRDYDQFGRGGAFPLENSKKDQRTVELWYQMQEYFTANYDGLNATFTKKSE